MTSLWLYIYTLMFRYSTIILVLWAILKVCLSYLIYYMPDICIYLILWTLYAKVTEFIFVKFCGLLILCLNYGCNINFSKVGLTQTFCAMDLPYYTTWWILHHKGEILQMKYLLLLGIHSIVMCL